MMIKFARFNIYLAVALTLLFATGCATDPKKKEKKQATVLSLHLQVAPGQDAGSARNQTVSINRENPLALLVETSPFADGADVEEASVVNEYGSFSLRLKLSFHGALLLDQMTSANRNDKRIAVFCAWDKEKRWLAAPVIRQRISDGIFTFTPDATLAETERIVRGLNNVAKELKKRDTW